MTKHDLKELWDGLRQHRGSFARVVKESKSLRPQGYTHRHLYRVLNGKTENTALAIIAAEVVEKCRREKAAQELQFTSVMKRAKALQA